MVILFAGITNVFAQKHVAENAIKVAALVPAQGVVCSPGTKSCAVTNKSTDRSITVKIEETFEVNKQFFKKTIMAEKVVPGENRYIGCAGCPANTAGNKCIGYKIVLAYFEEPDSVRVRALLNEKDEPVSAR